MSVKDLFRLDGRVALVTGGSRGLGLQMAEALGEMGCRLAITARKADELAEAQQQLQGRGYDVLTITSDLQQAEAVAPLVDQVLARYGQIDILVNNAGATWGAPAEDYPDAAWHKVMNLNVTAPFLLSREVGRRSMIPRQQGKIINIASVAGLKGTAAGVHTIAYNTSKAALINFTRTLASEWGRYNINVNAICPGYIETEINAHHWQTEAGQKLIQMLPRRRVGKPEDLDGVLMLLASDRSQFVNGAVIAADDGFGV
jgi:gluconate 5-dehydrogenase